MGLIENINQKQFNDSLPIKELLKIEIEDEAFERMYGNISHRLK